MATPARSTRLVRRSRCRSAKASVGDLRRDVPSSRQRLHAGEQLREREGLGQIVVAARLQSLDAVVDRVAGTQEQHGDRHAGSPKRADEAETVQARQHDIDYGSGVGLVLRKIQAVDAVVSHVHSESFLPQPGRHKLGDASIIFDHEDAHAVIVVCAGSRRQGRHLTRFSLTPAVLLSPPLCAIVTR